MNIVIPVLDEVGYRFSPQEILEHQFSYFCTTSMNVNPIFELDAISSFPYLMQKNSENITDLISDVQNTLTSLFERYFSFVDVQVADISDDPTSMVTTISIYLEVNDDKGESHNIYNAIVVKDSKLLRVLNLNNKGDI